MTSVADRITRGANGPAGRNISAGQYTQLVPDDCKQILDVLMAAELAVKKSRSPAVIGLRIAMKRLKQEQP